jgi:calreticulin
MFLSPLIILFVSICTIHCTIYFREDFDTPAWQDKWVQSSYPDKEFGDFEWTAGKFYGDDLKDKGIKTSLDAKFYGLSAKFEDNKFDNEGKDLVIQFSGML